MSYQRTIDLSHPDVFVAECQLGEVNDWLMDPGAELVDVNSAIDNAASWARDAGTAYVVIKIGARS